jgi:hypothetical protein
VRMSAARSDAPARSAQSKSEQQRSATRFIAGDSKSALLGQPVTAKVQWSGSPGQL